MISITENYQIQIAAETLRVVIIEDLRDLRKGLTEKEEHLNLSSCVQI